MIRFYLYFLSIRISGPEKQHTISRDNRYGIVLCVGQADGCVQGPGVPYLPTLQHTDAEIDTTPSPPWYMSQPQQI